MQELIKRLEENHGNCAEDLAKKAAADADAASAVTVNPDAPNVLQTMMKLEQANARAKTVNKVVTRAPGTPTGTASSSLNCGYIGLVNSSELRTADFPLTEVRPLQLDAVAHGDRRARGAAVRKLQGVGNSTFVLSMENDNDFRSRCE